MNTHSPSLYVATLGSTPPWLRVLWWIDFANMSDDEYLRERMQDEIDSMMADAELYEEFEDEQLQNPCSFVERV